MRETGTVTKVKANRATVKVDKKDECSKCGMCLFPKGASSVEFIADNPLSADVGDTVVIERKESGKLLGAILAFLVPLILIGISVFLAYVVVKKEIWVLIFSVIFIFLWYNICHEFERE